MIAWMMMPTVIRIGALPVAMGPVVREALSPLRKVLEQDTIIKTKIKASTR